MIISSGRRYIFVHIPKTGGTSLALALEGRAMKDDILIGDTPKAQRRKARLKGLSAPGRLWKHATLADIDGLVPLEGMFIVTMVRNPWDRMVSYYHWARAQDFDHPAVSLARTLSFDAFLAHPRTEASFARAPYASYVTDGAGRERCDLFIRLEHLDEDLPKLEAHLGFALAPLPHENPSGRPPDYRHLYSEAQAARLGHLCAQDITRFGYSF